MNNIPKEIINTELEDIELTDYPYIGIGRKPQSSKHNATDDQLERIVAG